MCWRNSTKRFRSAISRSTNEKYVADRNLARRHDGKAGTRPTLKKLILVAFATELLALAEIPQP